MTGLIAEIGRLILSDGRIRDAEWEAISVVAYDGGSGVFGYMYRRDGTWRGQAPQGFEYLDRARDLNRAMSANGDPPSKTAFIQLRRSPDIRLNVQFDYEDASRWRVAPGALQDCVEDLRPR